MIIMFDDNLRANSASFFPADFNLLSFEFDNFTFTHCIESFYINIILNQNQS